MGTAYSYDGLGRLISAVPANYSSSTAYTAESGTEEVLYTYDSRGNLETITTDSTVYTLTYDSYRNPEAIKAGDNTLATYEYNPGNGKLVKVIYGNGFVEEYVYNSLEMLTEIWYTYASGEEILAVSYTYNDDGQLHRVDDHINGRSSVYEYTPGGRLSCISEFETDEMFNKTALLFSYDGKGRLEQLLLSLDYAYGSYRNTEKIFNFYSYKDDGSLNHYSVLAGSSYLTEIDYYYDDFGRLSTVSGELDGWLELRREYDYRSVGNYTSSQVAAFRTLIYMTETEYLYTYDANGNITKITVDGDEIRYVYDNLGQLLREDNEVLNKTYVYTYDKAGNILTKKTYALTAASVTPTSPTSTVNYGYSSGEWGDLLTSYKGYSNYYDEIGNPTSYYNGTRYYFTWSGRQLTGASKGSVSYTFSYNDEGIRTSKTVGGVEHTYRLNGSQILSEEWDNKMISFVYDASGTPICMRYRETSYDTNTWDLYWIETNMHGDVIAIYDNYADLLVSYTYDAWGNQTITYSNGGASTPAQYNPFRYRGYYYDIDLGLYYLNARYYDSNTGRFINGDASLYHNMLGYNTYVYCNNNPVAYFDPTGQSFATFMIKLGITLPALDGPLPIGDIAAVVLVVCGGVAHLANASKSKTNIFFFEGVYIPKVSEKEPPKSVTEAEAENSSSDSEKVDDNELDNKDNSLPTTGEPNSDKNLYDKKGLKQTRHYGPDGRAEYDIDYRHSGEKHKFPHKHYWNWNSPNPRGKAIHIFLLHKK